MNQHESTKGGLGACTDINDYTNIFNDILIEMLLVSKIDWLVDNYRVILCVYIEQLSNSKTKLWNC